MITKLKLVRIKKQFTQESLGKKCGISQGRFSLIERGLKMPTNKEAKRLAEILCVPADELFNDHLKRETTDCEGVNNE